ncbi:MAG: carboxypeptidase regulatory-like domain-containing protein [Cyclobacteriaceae bacterium]
MKKNLLNLFFTLLITFAAQNGFSQSNTTATVNGSIVDDQGEVVIGATILAVHTPSGSQYGAVSNIEGRYFIPGLRVGGPYTITISFVGFATQIKEGITLGLGDKKNIDIVLKTEDYALDAVVVTAENDEVFNSGKTGATTNLSLERINSLPTINRSVNDFTRLTPQSNGTSFAGRDSRFNNYTIDGNIYNNNFGLGSSQFAGGNPISLDAIEEIQVNIAPYDVRQGGFSGASVNAITKSGTNSFEGSVYYYVRNDQLIGDKVGETRLAIDDSKNEIRGFRVGGPIIKDKLFFFLNYEAEEELVPSFNKVSARPGLTPDGLTVSRVPSSDLDFVRESLSSLYGYETGPYEGYSFASEQERFNARIDWNISKNHKLAVRYNLYTAFTDVPTNGNSVRFISERFRNTDRTGIEAMNFRNTNYTNDRKVQSFVAELNSILTPNISNQLNVGFTAITDPKRGIPGDQAFPFIEVLEDDGSGNDLYYFSVGNELFSVGNLLENNIFNITNNTTIFKGNHTITAGINFEYMTFDNAFNPVFNGFYRYGSYDDFVSAVIDRDPTVQPLAFAQSFAFDGSTTPPTDQTRFGQLGLYVQDEYQYSSNLRLTAGLRVDLPFYPINLPNNAALDALNKQYTDLNGDTFTPDVSSFPSVKPLFSPRIGANWDVNGDKTTQVRGGTGIFSGRIPFVWLSNQVNGSGVVRGGLGLERERGLDPTDPDYLGDFAANPIPFDPNVNAYRPASGEATLSNELNLTDENFRLPQTWRTNIAVDQLLPFGVVGTLEAIYSKDVSTPIAYNPVLRTPDGVLAGPDARPYWDGGYSNDDDFRNVFYLTNADEQGDYMSITAELKKQFDNGFYTSVAYTRSRARDYGLDGGSQAISLWSAQVREDRNNPELSYTRFDQPNRLIGLASYQTDNTTISVFYQGGEVGRFSYTYSGNFGDNAQRLLYVPNRASELNFEEFSSGGVTYTVADQEAAFDAYINQDDYLSDKRGEVAERNGAKLPWVHTFDLRLTQDIPLANQHKFQLSLDILNFGNLINSDFGIPQTPNQSNVLNFRGRNDNNEPVYRMNFVPGTTEFPTETFRESTSLANTWRAQLGIRYIFN